ncbi:hypothetical protein HDU86_003896 [Geranomyces michiganensis]|nr:hypothetical protein HDU86_003896 [Geranomyces michiganensis]
MEIARPQQKSGTTAAVSLYQQTMTLIEKLYSLPGFDFYMFPHGIDENTVISPFEVIWSCFRLGSPFCHLYNQLRPRKRLAVPDVPTLKPPYNNTCKKAVYEFIVACKAELQMEDKELFSISGLYKDDTNEFVKLVETISIVVQKIENSGLFPPPRPLPFLTPSTSGAGSKVPSDNRAKVVAEMLNTERQYSTDLEKLQHYQRELQSQNIVPRDMILQLFANLDELLDFQRRFLLQMEATLSLPPAEQRLGQLFIQNEQAFSVYIPFCGNYQLATTLAAENAALLSRCPEMDPVRDFASYLIKPVQRVCKYPLLFNELIKFTDADKYPYMQELSDGLAAIKRVTDLVNEEKRQEENRRIKADVFERVEDWKGLNTSEFGNLLLSDKFPMNNGEAEKDFELFLFENILLCCKDTNKKRKTKRGNKDEVTTAYALKGNIYIERVDSIADETSASQQRFQLKVFWRDGMDMESFVLRCRNQEQVNLWKGRLDGLLQVERMRKMSLRDASSYSRSTQLHPDITRGMTRGSASNKQAYDDDMAQQQQQQQQRPSRADPRFDARSPADMPSSVTRSKSNPNNYYAGAQNVASPYQSDLIPSPYHADPSVPSSRKSAPAPPKARGSTFSPDYNYERRPSRGRSSSPPPNGRIVRDTSPPPPMPPNVTSPQSSSYDMSYSERKRERSRSRPRNDENSSGAKGYGGSAPQIPLPDLPTGMILNGRLPPPPSAPLPPPPGGRRPSRSERAGYFDGAEEVSAFRASSRRGDFSPTSELPPSPPSSVPNSPIGQRKSSMLPPPIMTGRSLTSPYPLSQLANGQNEFPLPPSLQLPPAPRPAGRENGSSASSRENSMRNNYDSASSSSSSAAAAAGRPALSYGGGGAASFSGYDGFGTRPLGPVSRLVGEPQMYTRSNSTPDMGLSSRGGGGGRGGPPNMPLPPTPGMGSSTASARSLSSGLPYNLTTQNSSASMASAGSVNGSLASANSINNINNNSNNINPPQTPISGGAPSVRVKMHYGTDVFVVAVPASCTFPELQSKMERKVRMCGGAAAAAVSDGRRFRMRYRDEDGDFIAINDSRDVAMAFEASRVGGGAGGPASGGGGGGDRGFISLWIV